MEEGCGEAKTLLQILEDRIHTIHINLLDGLSKSLGEIEDGFILPLENGLQRTDVSLLPN